MVLSPPATVMSAVPVRVSACRAKMQVNPLVARNDLQIATEGIGPTQPINVVAAPSRAAAMA